MRIILTILELLLEHPLRAFRWGMRKLDRAILALVRKADHGVVGAVHSIERRVAAMTATVRRSGRRVAARLRILLHRIWGGITWPGRIAARAAIAAARSLRHAERNAVEATSRTTRVFVGEVTSLLLAVFGAPGRLGRALETLVVYWVTGIRRASNRIFGQAFGRALRPLRKRQAARLRREAGVTMPMTSDHHAQRELLVLAAGVLLLATAGWLYLGGSVPSADATRVGSGLSFGSLADAVAAMSPLRMTILAAALALFAVATVFWTRMLRDSYRREYSTAVERTQWRLVTTLLFVPGAVLYFFKQYNRLPLRRFAARHLLSLMVTGMAVVVASSTYGTLWYFNQQAEAEIDGAGYAAPNLRLDPQDREGILSRDKYGAPLRRAKTGRSDPFAPLPGEQREVTASDTSPSPSPSPTPES
ncbi:MAG: hypothetical protein M3N59_02695 [bacterium]|nr:hypothetical protein [bacterium]